MKSNASFSPIIILSLIMVGDLSRHVERTNNCKEGENALKISKKKKKKNHEIAAQKTSSCHECSIL